MEPLAKRGIAVAVSALVVAGAAAALAYWFTRPAKQPKQLILYGNVDLRQVDLAFNGNERIAAVLVQEGDVVHKGQVLAKMDTSRLAAAVRKRQGAGGGAAGRGGAAPQRQPARRDRSGAGEPRFRQADAENDRRLYERENSLLQKASATQQDVDNSKAALDVADAKVEVNQKALDLAIAGPRVEDIAQAEAQLRANEAQLALARAAAGGREADCAGRRRRPLPPDGAGRHGFAATPGVFAGGHRSEMGPRLRVGARPRPRSPRHEGLGDGGRLSHAPLCRLGRFHLAGRRVHAEDGADRRAADESRLRGARVRAKTRRTSCGWACRRQSICRSPRARHRSQVPPRIGRP